MKIIVVSGGFDPIHSGHISYLKAAKKYGEKLIILLNSDDWLCRKKKFFLPFNERKMILENLMMVDEVIEFEDDQIGSCINGLKIVKEENIVMMKFFSVMEEIEKKKIHRKLR